MMKATLINTIKIFIQKKENKNNLCAILLDIYIYIENGEIHTKLFDKLCNFDFEIVRMPLHCSNIHNKMLHGSIGGEILGISTVTSKIKDLSRTCKELFS